MVHSRGRPKFGFGFGAESCQIATFGRVSVSAETAQRTFGLLSASAESDLHFRPPAESLLIVYYYINWVY